MLIILRILFTLSTIGLIPTAGAAVLLSLLDQSPQCNVPCSLDYYGVITNTNSTRIYLNGTELGGSPGPVYDDSAFYVNAPFYLDPGDTFQGLLFQAAVAAPFGQPLASGQFAVFGGSGEFDFDELARVYFSININSNDVPEPAPIAGTAAALIFFLCAKNRSRLHRRGE